MKFLYWAALGKKTKKSDSSALWSKLTNVELSDLSAETMHTQYAVRPTTPTSYCCVCMAALVKLWWVFPPWEAEHDMRSTMAGRWRASSIWWWPLSQRPLFLMWRNTRAAWFIMGAQVARDLMSHILCSSNGSLRGMHMLKNKCVSELSLPLLLQRYQLLFLMSGGQISFYKFKRSTTISFCNPTNNLQCLLLIFGLYICS